MGPARARAAQDDPRLYLVLGLTTEAGGGLELRGERLGGVVSARGCCFSPDPFRKRARGRDRAALSDCCPRSVALQTIAEIIHRLMPPVSTPRGCARSGTRRSGTGSMDRSETPRKPSRLLSTNTIMADGEPRVSMRHRNGMPLLAFSPGCWTSAASEPARFPRRASQGPRHALFDRRRPRGLFTVAACRAAGVASR